MMRLTIILDGDARDDLLDLALIRDTTPSLLAREIVEKALRSDGIQVELHFERMKRQAAPVG